MYLVDASIWVAVFRANPEVDLRDEWERDEVVTCMPVIQEVLQGFRHEAAFRLARTALLALPRVEDPMCEDAYLQAADLYRMARRAGWTIRSGVDCLIATCAIRNDLEVLHRDRDFDSIAQVSALRARRL